MAIYHNILYHGIVSIFKSKVFFLFLRYFESSIQNAQKTYEKHYFNPTKQAKEGPSFSFFMQYLFVQPQVASKGIHIVAVLLHSLWVIKLCTLTGTM